ncbi:MAG: hypothetical protein ACRDHD_10980, partial [Candidatus Limnocylindria bacterium]
MAFDPTAPLPGAPVPWAPSVMPARRDGPPWAMTEMIAAEPTMGERLARRLGADPALRDLAAALRLAADGGRPILTTGCGTSEHAAMAGAGVLADALRSAGLPADRVASVQAFELAARVPPDALVAAVSHEGGT